MAEGGEEAMGRRFTKGVMFQLHKMNKFWRPVQLTLTVNNTVQYT